MANMKISFGGRFSKREQTSDTAPRREPVTVDVTGTPLAGVIETTVKKEPIYVTTGGKPCAVLVDFEWWRRFSAEIEDVSR